MGVTVSDVEARYGRSFEAAERPRVEAFITDATALVADYCGSGYRVDDPCIVAVVCAEVIRWLSISPGVVSEKVGDVEVNFGATTVTQFLSPAARVSLRRFRKKLISVQLIVGDTVPVPIQPAGPQPAPAGRGSG